MKLIAAGLILSLATIAQANNVKIVKMFDGKNARCSERADLGGSAYRLKGGSAVQNEDSVSLRLTVNSLACARSSSTRSGFELVDQAPGNQIMSGMKSRNHKLLLTDENYKVVGAHTLDTKTANTDAEIVVALTEEQKATLAKGQNVELELVAFIQSIVESSDGSALTGSGAFAVKVSLDATGMATLTVK